MGTRPSRCAGSAQDDMTYEKKINVMVEERTGISSENESSDSDKTRRNALLKEDLEMYEPSEASSDYRIEFPEYRNRTASMESESSIDFLKSMIISQADIATATIHLLQFCESGSAATVRSLLAHHGSLNVMLNDYHVCNVGDREMYITPLMLAAACGHPHIVDLFLMTPSVLVNAKSNDAYDQTALHIAVSLGQLKCVQALVDNLDVDVNIRDGLEMTPLHVAINGHFDEAVKLLLGRKDIDYGLQDSNGNNILHIGAMSNNLTALKLIIQHASLSDLSEVSRYGDLSPTEEFLSVWRPSMGDTLKLLTDACNNDGLNVKAILTQNIAALKSPSLSGTLRTSDYLEMCDDAHRCLVIYTRATCYPSSLTNEGDINAIGEDHSPQEDITTALSWSPQAVLRKNGSYSKACSPLSH